MLNRVILFALAGVAFAQQPPQQAQQQSGQAAAPAAVRPGERSGSRTPLFFRETWKTVPNGGEHPVTQEQVASANLELKLYGPAGQQLQALGKEEDPSNPPH